MAEFNLILKEFNIELGTANSINIFEVRNLNLDLLKALHGDNDFKWVLSTHPDFQVKFFWRFLAVGGVELANLYYMADPDIQLIPLESFSPDAFNGGYYTGSNYSHFQSNFAQLQPKVRESFVEKFYLNNDFSSPFFGCKDLPSFLELFSPKERLIIYTKLLPHKLDFIQENVIDNEALSYLKENPEELQGFIDNLSYKIWRTKALHLCLTPRDYDNIQSLQDIIVYVERQGKQKILGELFEKYIPYHPGESMFSFVEEGLFNNERSSYTIYEIYGVRVCFIQESLLPLKVYNVDRLSVENCLKFASLWYNQYSQYGYNSSPMLEVLLGNTSKPKQ